MSLPTMETLAGGRWIGGGDWIDVFDPADVREPYLRVPALTAEQVTATYAGAEAGFAVWRAMPAITRSAILAKASALLRIRNAEIAGAIVRENGKSPAEARVEAEKAADFFEYYAGVGRQEYGSLIHDVRPDTRTGYQREPLGVVLAITPWNDPLITPARKLAPALAAGNAVVLKPASETPTSALHLARALHDAGVPAGVVNVVTGRTAEISDALLDDPRIAAVSFTGGNKVGEALRVRLAARGVRFQSELGGKNASVVLAGANLPKAAAAVAAAAFGQAGQRCTATSRLLVDRAVHDGFLPLLLAEIRKLRVGPLVSRAQQRSVVAHIDLAVKQGAVVELGGGEVPGPGCHVEPTVLTGVTADMDVWREEVFGPVLAVRVVDGLDEAITAVNDTRYGLAAAVFTDSLAAAHRFLAEVDCGQIAVNTTTSGWDVHQPFGGFRDSGSPFKEQGPEAMRFYTKVKTFAIHFGS
jgi:acyl-CoA reductase-like NAD-dependent aldehyde dehydrogenase